MPMPLKRLNKRFGRLVTIKWIPETQSYLCRCDCGKEKIVRTSSLNNGSTSCGCYRDEMYAARGQDKRKSRLNAIGRYYRRNAITRNIEWTLSNPVLESIISQSCFYCGKFGSLGFDFTGLDRIDNTKGYLQENVVPCCKRCNQGKNDMPVEEFYEWAKSIYLHHQKEVSSVCE